MNHSIAILVAVAVSCPLLAGGARASSCGASHAKHESMEASHGHHHSEGAFHDLFEDYDAMRLALLDDSLEGVSKHARAMEKRAGGLGKDFAAAKAGVSEENSESCHELLSEIEKAAHGLAKATSLDPAREAFAELTRPMVRYREMVSGERPVVVYCSMAGKAWLQPEGEIGNPYYGQKMARCGEVVSQ